jgi:hypothetical protein
MAFWLGSGSHPWGDKWVLHNTSPQPACESEQSEQSEQREAESGRVAEWG